MRLGTTARLAERRRLLEQVRTVSVTRLRSDLDKTVRQEAAFAARLLREAVPLRLVWKDGAVPDLAALLPFRVELTDGGLEEGVHASPAPPRPAEDDDDVVDRPIA